MKKLIALILAFICLYGYAIGESPATPTDLEGEYIFEDDDWGCIDIPRQRRVFLMSEKQPQYVGDTAIFYVVLMDFSPNDNIQIYWQYATDSAHNKWISIENEHDFTYTFIVNEINMYYWYRVLVEVTH